MKSFLCWEIPTPLNMNLLLNTPFIQSQRKKAVAVVLFMLLLVFKVDVMAIEDQTQTKKSGVDVLVAELDQEFARGTIISIQMAELALSKLEQVQTKVQEIMQAKELACHEDFFTNSCLQDIRLKKRQLQETFRQISIEAKSFIRRARIAKSQTDSNNPPH